MNEYIDSEKLITEIERRQVQLRNACGDRVFSGKEKRDMIVAYEELDRLRAIITSLQQEQQEVDLEKEIERIVKNEEKFMKFQVRHQLIRYVARHFAEWGAIHLNIRKEE